MKKVVKKVDGIISKMKQEDRNSVYWYILVIQPDLSRFFKSIGSVSSFFRKLTNSKIKKPGCVLNNRDWWKKIGAKGFYRYFITKGSIEIVIFIESDERIYRSEIKGRIENIIGSSPLHFGEFDEQMLENKICSVDVLDSGIELFGEYKKEKLNVD